MKALMRILRKEIVVGITCWEVKSQLFEASVLPTFTYGTKIWGGNLKDSHWKVFEKGIRDAYAFSCQSAFFNYLSYLIGHIQITSPITICSQAHYGLSIMAPDT